MINSFNRFIIIFVFFSFLFSCQKTEILDEVVFDYNLLNKINFNAEVKEIYNLYKVNLSLPFIDHVMEVSPSKRIEKWFEENLIVFGTSNKLVLNILNASITKNEFKNDSNKKKVIENKEYIYKITIEVNYILYNDDESILATTNVKISRTTTAANFISLSERNRILDLLALEALQDLSVKSSELVKKHMFEYII